MRLGPSRWVFAGLAFLAASWLGAAPARAYVTYNRLGYVSCTACHFSPIGGGLLTPYGQSIQASLAAIPQERDPAEKGWYAGVEARVLGTDTSTRANPFLMQTDLLATAFVTQRVRADVIAGPSYGRGESGTFAWIPPGEDAVVVRRALLNVSLTDEISLAAGRDFAIPGLNLDDHTALIRSRTRLGVLDYTTQLRFQYQSEKWQLLPYLSAPSYEESTANREWGGGARAEYALGNSNSVGVVSFLGSSPSITRLNLGGYFRLSQDHWNGLVGEYLLTSRWVKSPEDTQSFAQHNFYLKPYVAPLGWLETGFVAEYLRVEAPFLETTWRYGPSVNVRIHEYLSLLGDGRNVARPGANDWSWYGQVFFHLQI